MKPAFAALFAFTLIAGIAAAQQAPAVTAPAKPGPVVAPAKTALAKAAPAAKAAPKPLAANAELLSHGRFQDMTVYHPKGTPTSFVIFLSGDGGWNLGVIDMAQALVQKGAMVVGINTPKTLAGLDQSKNECEYVAGDFENLSHYVQAYFKLPTYLEPILVGYSSGATFAYATLVQAPTNTFGGAIVLGFCPDLDLHEPLCKGPGPGLLQFTKRKDGKGVDLEPSKGLVNPVTVMQGEVDQVCAPDTTKAFMSQVGAANVISLPKVGHGYSVTNRWQPQYLDAFDKLSKAVKPESVAPPPTSLNGLPVIEVPAKAGVPETGAFALLMTGDGGWAGLDQEVAAALSAQGIPVVGLDSLRYYWTPRTPESAAVDTDRIVRYYLSHWKKDKVLLVGYSQGADVLPFIINRLPAETRSHVALGTVMGLSEHALFEFHLGNWVNATQDQGLPTMPEMVRDATTPMLCIYGEKESDTLCPKLDPNKVHVVKLQGAHHFNGNYQKLAQEILSTANLPIVTAAAGSAADTAGGQTSADGESLSDTENQEGSTMLSFHVFVTPVLSLVAGILILVMPRLLNYIVAVYLIAVGALGLLPHLH